MIFPEKVSDIPLGAKVLEVGPGNLPHPRSDVYLDKAFDPEEYFKQCGNVESKVDRSKIVFYDGGAFPFEDNKFDYVICSHVIEHVPSGDLALFISELQRVAPKGYLEFPASFYEILCFPEGHLWFMSYRDGTILFFPREKFPKSWFHKSMQEMWFQKGGSFRYSFRKDKKFFFIGFEWDRNVNPLKYEILDEFSDLVTEGEFNDWKTYFQSKKTKRKTSLRKRFRRMIKKYFSK